MNKRILSVFLALCLLLALPLGALAAENGEQPTTDAATEAADRLHALGLFIGTKNDEDGNPVYELDRTPNRAEAITMLVRLLGKDEEAQTGTWDIPFTDVPPWAVPYVGYAYANGLTKGVKLTAEVALFGTTSPASATMYLTFVLRALGYADGTDFQWNAAWELTDAKGITNGEYSAENNSMSRGDLVIVSADSLSAEMKDGGETLIQTLVESGAVGAEAAAAQGYDVEVPEPEPDADISIAEGANGLVIEVMSQRALTEALSQTNKVAEINITKDFTVTEASGVSFEGDKLDLYADAVMTIAEGTTLTVAEGGEIGVLWFTYEGDWETGTVPNGKFINNGTLIVEKDGWVNGEFTENNGTIIVKDGGQCQTIPNRNTGDVTVESGGSYRTTQGNDVYNEGTVQVEEGANMVSRFGTRIINNGTIRMDGLLSVGYLYMPPQEDAGDGSAGIEMLWLENNGEITGTGTVRVYDAFNEETESDRADIMVALMTEAIGDDTTLTIIAGIGTGV